jgi:hypothetical protein
MKRKGKGMLSRKEREGQVGQQMGGKMIVVV